jgi:hypothetical protein
MDSCDEPSLLESMLALGCDDEWALHSLVVSTGLESETKRTKLAVIAELSFDKSDNKCDLGCLPYWFFDLRIINSGGGVFE